MCFSEVVCCHISCPEGLYFMIQSPHFGRPPGGFFVCVRQGRQVGPAGSDIQKSRPGCMLHPGRRLCRRTGPGFSVSFSLRKQLILMIAKKRRFFHVCFSLLSVYVGTECSQETCKPGNRMGGLRSPKKGKAPARVPGHTALQFIQYARKGTCAGAFMLY